MDTEFHRETRQPSTTTATEVVPESNDSSETIRDILNVAEEYFQKGQLQRSEQILQQLLLQDTREPRVFYLLGAIYYDLGKHNRAEVAFKRCLDLNADFRDASIALTILYNELGEYSKAEELYQKARQGVEQKNLGRDIHLDTVFAQKHEELGNLYFEHEFFNEAHHEYEKATVHQPKNLDFMVKSAKALDKSGAKQAAIEKLKDLKSAFPEFIPARLTLGMCYFNAHRVPEAVSEWEAVLRREPQHKEAQLYLKVASQAQVTSV